MRCHKICVSHAKQKVSQMWNGDPKTSIPKDKDREKKKTCVRCHKICVSHVCCMCVACVLHVCVSHAKRKVSQLWNGDPKTSIPHLGMDPWEWILGNDIHSQGSIPRDAFPGIHSQGSKDLHSRCGMDVFG